MKEGKKKVYNWEAIDFTEAQLLNACLEAFNEIPRKRLKSNSEGFPDTYAIASALEGWKMKALANEQELKFGAIKL